jgi:hypothetical protein
MLNNLHKILALNEIGSVNQLLQKFDPKLGVSEGIGKYSYLSVESTTPKPYTQNTEITIPLTNSNVDVVEFHRSFFTLILDIWVNVWTPDDYAKLFCQNTGNTSDAPASQLARQYDKFFIGCKNATDIIDSYKIQHNCVDIGTTMQNRAGIESFLYNQMKPQIEKSNKPSSYSLWEDVVCADEGVCGIYVTYQQLVESLTPDSHRLHIKWPVTIGFDMLLPLQGFNMFPNCLFGDLSLVIKVSPNALVWACTDPQLYLVTNAKLSSMLLSIMWGDIKSYNMPPTKSIHQTNTDISITDSLRLVLRVRPDPTFISRGMAPISTPVMVFTRVHH